MKAIIKKKIPVILILSLSMILQGSLSALWGDSDGVAVQRVNADSFYDVWDGVESVTVDNSAFPDNYFQEYVRNRFGDELTKEEALSLTDLHIKGLVYQLDQLKYFPSLETVVLDEYRDDLPMDFSFLPNLSYIHLSSSTEWEGFEYEEGWAYPNFDFSNNQYLHTIEFDNIDVGMIVARESLSSISIRNCLNLSRIEVQESNITSLDLSGAPNLEQLNIMNTDIKNLDVSGNPLLKKLYCGRTKLRTLDLSNNSKLTELDCRYTSTLKTVDVSSNKQLNKLGLVGTSVSAVDLSDCSNLGTFTMGGDCLVALDLSDTAIDFYGGLWTPELSTAGGFYEKGDHRNRISADENGVVDMRKIDPQFDYSRVTINDSAASVTEEGFKFDGDIPDGFSYEYDTGLYFDGSSFYHENDYTQDMKKFLMSVYIEITNPSSHTEEPSEEFTEAQDYVVHGVVNTTGKVDFEFNENDFAEDSSNYNHTIGKAAAALSLLAYNPSMFELYDALIEQMGFTGMQVWNEHMQDDTEEGKYSPYMIAHKKIMLDGEKTELIVVVIRGTYKMEWLDDFDSGTTEIHEGFNRARQFIMDGLYSYIANEKTFDNNAKMKILVTGHSRGAAVANLIGKDLNDTTLYTDNLSKDGIFVYTFASPNPAVMTKREKSSYKNIFNIVNPEDFVTKVMPTKWGKEKFKKDYGRYGKTYVLPSRTTDKWEDYTWGTKNHIVDYTDYLQKVKASYRKLNAPMEYVPYPDGEKTLSDYVSYVYIYVGTVDQYYNKNLYTCITHSGESSQSLHELYKYALGGKQSENEKYMDKSKEYIVEALTLSRFGMLGVETVSFFFNNQILDKRFECAHRAETYFSAMDILSSEELRQPREVLVGEVNCPVDVTIRDPEGNIVGQIVNNEVNDAASSEDSSVVMSVEGESKQFSIPKGADFTIEITGNDSGTMDYSLRERDADTGEIQRVFYQEIPVTTSTVLTQTIENSPDPEDAKLLDNKGNVVEPKVVIVDSSIGKLSAEVTVTGNGFADSMYNLNPGDYITLKAMPDEGNEFAGWFDDAGKPLSTEPEYGISMKESIHLTAKFKVTGSSDNPDDPDDPATPTPDDPDDPVNPTPDNPGDPVNPTPTPTPTPDPTPTPAPAPAEDTKPAHTHTYGEWTTTTPATEVADGVQTRTCTGCGNTETQTIAMLKPTLKAVKITKPTVGKKSATIKWKKIAKKDLKKIKKVEIQYSQDKTFTSGVKTKYASAKKTLLTIKKLKSKKTYYVRIRAYTKSGSTVHVSKWSSVKKLKIK